MHSIRAARDDEHDKLAVEMARLFLSAYSHASTPQNVRAYVESAFRPEQQAQELRDPRLETLIVEDGSGWAGFAQLGLEAPPPIACAARTPGVVRRFYLDPRAHGRGLAQALMDTLKQRARARGADLLWLGVWQEALRAIRFYEKTGFRIAGTMTFMLGPDLKVDWVMTCEL